MASLEDLIKAAREQAASDVHAEPGYPILTRCGGRLRKIAPALSAPTVQSFAKGLLSPAQWSEFSERGSFDLSRSIAGIRCRVNVMHTDRGIGLAIRLLAPVVRSLAECNIHPSLTTHLECDSGLILLTGPTGSGKSTTLAACIEEINRKEARHIVSLEQPIEYRLPSKKSLIRQREVGRHTPSFSQGLMDALREDPDVLIVSEMRDPETMRLTLNAAETGHLVLATLHSTNAAEAIYRMMMSFPPERQSSVLAQLADTLIAIISQKMSYRSEINSSVPVCEILVGTMAVKNTIRKAEVSRVVSLIQTGGSEGMWTFERYQAWLDRKTDWVIPASQVSEDEQLPDEFVPEPKLSVTPIKVPPPSFKKAQPVASEDLNDQGRIEIPDIDDDLEDLLRQFED